MKSLQLRLALALLISLLGAVSLLWWQTKLSIRQLAEDNVAEHLEHDAEAILEAVDLNNPDTLTLTDHQIEPVYTKPYSGQYYRVMADHQTIRSPSLKESDFNVPVLNAGTRKRFYETGPKGQPLLIMAYGYKKFDRLITVAVAEDLSPTLKIIANFQNRYSLFAAVLLVFLILIQTVILRTGFLPLARIRNQLSALEKGERKQIDTDVPMEVSALVNEFNRLLTVLEQRLQRSRNALADLAHALKTPLTVLRQLPREEAFKAQPELCEILITQTTNMQRLMERVLKRARLAGSGPPLAKFDIHHEIPDLIRVLKNMYRDKNLSIRYSAPKIRTISIDREDMLELAGILLDNACKWADSRVDLTIECSTPNLHLIVEDDGPGVSDDDVAKLLQRGTRLDEAVDGHGLGLSIAKVIAEQYRGYLAFRQSADLGGFCVEAVLTIAASGQTD